LLKKNAVFYRRADEYNSGKNNTISVGFGDFSRQDARLDPPDAGGVKFNARLRERLPEND